MTFNRTEKNVLLNALGSLLWEMENRLSMLQVPEEIMEVKELMSKIQADNERETVATVEKLLIGIP